MVYIVFEIHSFSLAEVPVPSSSTARSPQRVTNKVIVTESNRNEGYRHEDAQDDTTTKKDPGEGGDGQSNTTLIV